jgi:transcriptional repressor NrdR
MRCPWCGHMDDRVVDSRPAEGGDAIRRRRQCRSCGRRFTSYERVEQAALTVVKRDGTREPWTRGKLVDGLRKALANRPVTSEQLDKVVSRIETRLRRKGPEVTSQQIGVEVLQNLQKLDQVAYVRFASVYREFKDVSQFLDELKPILEGRNSPTGAAPH